MEINKFKENLNLSRKERELNYWIEIITQVLECLKKAPSINDKSKFELYKNYKNEHPIHPAIIEIVRTEFNEETLKLKIAIEIISYLNLIHENGNVIVDYNGIQSISKKSYSKEKKKILNDLKMMFFNSFLLKRINEFETIEENYKIPLTLIQESITKDFSSIYVIDSERWEMILTNLFQDGILSEKYSWISLGANLSKPATQLAVFVYLLEDNGIFKIMNQNKQIPEISKLFNVNLSSSRYSQVKKGFNDSEGVSKHMMHFSIYDKLIKYFN